MSKIKKTVNNSIPYMSIISTLMLLMAILLVSSATADNKTEILKSRATNLEGRAILIQTINDACRR